METLEHNVEAQPKHGLTAAKQMYVFSEDGSCVNLKIAQGVWTKIDPEDLQRVGSIRWYVYRKGKIAYVRRYRKGLRASLSRLVMHAKEGQIVDHINGDGLDNRKMNLRITDRSVNAQNRILTSNKKPLGVYKVQRKRAPKYRSEISRKGKRYHLGVFDSPIQAALAYDKAADALYGTLGARNFPFLISIERAVEWLEQLNGQIVTVYFTKRTDDGFRPMTCRKFVRKNLKGKGLQFNPRDYGLMSVYDMRKKSYRFINLNKIVALCSRGFKCRITQSQQ